MRYKAEKIDGIYKQLCACVIVDDEGDCYTLSDILDTSDLLLIAKQLAFVQE